MLVLPAGRLALLALDRELAALQASSRAAFFNAIAVTHEPFWPPPPFEPAAFEWARKGLDQDRDGAGWYGWALLANEGEAAPPRLAGMAALIGRPDEDGEVELAYALSTDFRSREQIVETVRALTGWAFANGAARVVAHLDAEDDDAVDALSSSGFADTCQFAYPGVARWALAAIES